MAGFTKAFLQAFIENASDTMNEQKEYLIDLDAALGDGDLGLTMSTGFQKAREFVPTYQKDDMGMLLYQIGMVFAQAVPSTMGTLVASGFMKAGKALKGKTEFDLADIATLAESFVEGIMERGKAQPGQRTIVDSLYPAAQAVKAACEAGKPAQDALADAVKAAEAGVEASKDMEPCFGRAVYFAEKTKGIPDQGAIVGRMLYEAMLKAVQ